MRKIDKGFGPLQGLLLSLAVGLVALMAWSEFILRPLMHAGGGR